MENGCSLTERLFIELAGIKLGVTLSSWIRKALLLSLPALIFALVAVELTLRVLGYMPYYLETRTFIPSPSPQRLYELRPGFRGLYASVPIVINSQGFRGRELPPASGTSVFRVLLVGDSVAFGQGVPEGQTLADQLTGLLESKRHGPAEVIDLGVPGYNSCQEYSMFQDRGLPLAPQVAVLIYVDNDTYPPAVRIEGNRIVTADVRTGLVGDFMAWLRKSSFAYNLLWSHWQVVKAHSPSINEYRQMLAKRFDNSSPGWRASRACVTALARVARAHSIRLIVVPFPEMSGLKEKPYPFQAYVQTVCDVARAAKAECLDVVPALQTPGLKLRISAVERHPTPEVHRKIAEQLEMAMR